MSRRAVAGLQSAFASEFSGGLLRGDGTSGSRFGFRQRSGRPKVGSWWSGSRRGAVIESALLLEWGRWRSWRAKSGQDHRARRHRALEAQRQHRSGSVGTASSVSVCLGRLGRATGSCSVLRVARKGCSRFQVWSLRLSNSFQQVSPCVRATLRRIGVGVGAVACHGFQFRNWQAKPPCPTNTAAHFRRPSVAVV
jgi:hypothetical protein